MLSKEDEKKYLDQMQHGMYLALEAAHYLGGRMEINYLPKVEYQPKAGGKNFPKGSNINERIVEAEKAIEIYKAMLDGKTAKELKKLFNLKSSYVPQYYHPVQIAVQRELLKKRYDNAPYQPRVVDPKTRQRFYDDNVHQLRRHKDFLLKVIANANKDQFIANILKHIY